MRNYIVTALFLPLFTLAAPLWAETESERLTRWLDDRYEEELAFSPMGLTELGRKQQYDQIDDYSEAALDAELAWQLGTVDDLRERFDYGALEPEAKVSYDYWVYRAERASNQAKWRRHDYVLDPVTSSHTDLPQFMINYHKVDTVQDMRDYIARLSGVARALGQLQARAAVAAGEGIRPPRFAYGVVIEQSRGMITGAPFENEGNPAPLWSDVLAKTAALREAGLVDDAQMQALRDRARAALVDEVGPAYRTLIAWLQQDRANADAQARGVHGLPDGGAYYAHRLRQYTTTDLSAEQVHQLGLEEVARIRGEMEAIREQVGFEGDLDAFFEYVRSDDRFYYPNTDAGRQAFIDETRHYLELIEDKLPQYFGILPKAGLEVRRVEAFRERDGASAFYEPGTADGSRPGVYYMHLSDMRANNRTDLQTTAYHEGDPGHHMQGSIALEREDLPLFRTNVWYSAYGEGWALYSELLAWEMGVYDNPYYDFGRLGAEIFRAIRLVVDTGMHAKGWSEERAVRYMLDNSAIPEASVRSEIQRYLVWPGQATSYKVGMLKILELRERAREALGDDFDIRDFHDLVLGGGSLPLDILERRVDEWIAAG
ncbi:DUF885 domain-containing protein [Parahaliea mediterranea]|uniref:DUF885 domain-containing protein n=1 Tax=Parahaliea mediterranea TaxID=651086 RepID=A0A939DH01_9GAMM|nr:DUF885 domain-containing protein [Parahaliea mediterranea]MBN7798064.1 DUF885 domain-containing protein [Parahaliea mediterranea]